MNTNEFELATAGYTILRGGLSPTRVAALRAAIDAAWQNDLLLWGSAALEQIGQLGALRNLCDQGAPFAKLLGDSPIYPLVQQFLGEQYILHSYDGLVLLPGQGRFPWDFHTDLGHLLGVSFPRGQTPAINCLYYLDDVTEQNGATWLIAASHQSIFSVPPKPEQLAQFAFQCTGEAGDILLFDARLWHCAGHNLTANPRRLIKALFCRPWVKQEMDYSRAVRPDVQETLDSWTLSLLGVDANPPATVAEFRQRIAKMKAATQP